MFVERPFVRKPTSAFVKARVLLFEQKSPELEEELADPKSISLRETGISFRDAMQQRVQEERHTLLRISKSSPQPSPDPQAPRPSLKLKKDKSVRWCSSKPSTALSDGMALMV